MQSVNNTVSLNDSRSDTINLLTQSQKFELQPDPVPFVLTNGRVDTQFTTNLESQVSELEEMNRPKTTQGKYNTGLASRLSGLEKVEDSLHESTFDSRMPVKVSQSQEKLLAVKEIGLKHNMNKKQQRQMANLNPYLYTKTQTTNHSKKKEPRNQTFDNSDIKNSGIGDL